MEDRILVTLRRAPGTGFGIAIKEIKADENTSIFISDVVGGGPAEGLVELNDIVVTINGIAIDNVGVPFTIQLLRKCISKADIIFRRQRRVPPRPLEHPGERDESVYVEMRPQPSRAHGGAEEAMRPQPSRAHGGEEEAMRPQPSRAHGGEEEAMRPQPSRAHGDVEEAMRPQPSRAHGGEEEAMRPQPSRAHGGEEEAMRPQPSRAHGGAEEAMGSDEPVYDYPRKHAVDLLVSPSDASMPSAAHDGCVYRSNMKVVKFKKTDTIGLTLAGGNDVGLFISRVVADSPAARGGLEEGDHILRVNEFDFENLIREDAVLFLMALPLGEEVTVITQKTDIVYREILRTNAADRFHIRTHFQYQKESKCCLDFDTGEVLRVVDSLFGGTLGSWLAVRLDRNNNEVERGVIPNQNRAEQLCLVQQLQSPAVPRPAGGSRVPPFWKLPSLKGNSSRNLEKSQPFKAKFPPYERVVLQEAGFLRPVVIFGPIADVAREKLTREDPDHFQRAKTEPRDAGTNQRNSGIISLHTVKQIIERGKHAVLDDVSLSAVERLNYAQWHPIVVFLRPDSKKGVERMRSRLCPESRKSSRKLYKRALELRKNQHHPFTKTIQLNSLNDGWHGALKDTIQQHQKHQVWVSEGKADDGPQDALDVRDDSLSHLSAPFSEYSMYSTSSYRDTECSSTYSTSSYRDTECSSTYSTSSYQDTDTEYETCTDQELADGVSLASVSTLTSACTASGSVREDPNTRAYPRYLHPVPPGPTGFKMGASQRTYKKDPYSMENPIQVTPGMKLPVSYRPPPSLRDKQPCPPYRDNRDKQPCPPYRDNRDKQPCPLYRDNRDKQPCPPYRDNRDKQPCLPYRDYLRYAAQKPCYDERQPSYDQQTSSPTSRQPVGPQSVHQQQPVDCTATCEDDGPSRYSRPSQPRKDKLPLPKLRYDAQPNPRYDVCPPPPNPRYDVCPPPPNPRYDVCPPPPNPRYDVCPPPPNPHYDVCPPPPNLGYDLCPPPPNPRYDVCPPPPNPRYDVCPPPPNLGYDVCPPPPNLRYVVRPPPPNLGYDVRPKPPKLRYDVRPPPPNSGYDVRPKPPKLGYDVRPKPPNPRYDDVRPPPNLRYDVRPTPPNPGYDVRRPPTIGSDDKPPHSQPGPVRYGKHMSLLTPTGAEPRGFPLNSPRSPTYPVESPQHRRGEVMRVMPVLNEEVNEECEPVVTASPELELQPSPASGCVAPPSSPRDENEEDPAMKAQSVRSRVRLFEDKGSVVGDRPADEAAPAPASAAPAPAPVLTPQDQTSTDGCTELPDAPEGSDEDTQEDSDVQYYREQLSCYARRIYSPTKPPE